MTARPPVDVTVPRATRAGNEVTVPLLLYSREHGALNRNYFIDLRFLMPRTASDLRTRFPTSSSLRRRSALSSLCCTMPRYATRIAAGYPTGSPSNHMTSCRSRRRRDGER